MTSSDVTFSLTSLLLMFKQLRIERPPAYKGSSKNIASKQEASVARNHHIRNIRQQRKEDQPIKEDRLTRAYIFLCQTKGHEIE